jgi:hypothetical protein
MYRVAVDNFFSKQWRIEGLALNGNYRVVDAIQGKVFKITATITNSCTCEELSTIDIHNGLEFLVPVINNEVVLSIADVLNNGVATTQNAIPDGVYTLRLEIYYQAATDNDLVFETFSSFVSMCVFQATCFQCKYTQWLIQHKPTNDQLNKAQALYSALTHLNSCSECCEAQESYQKLLKLIETPYNYCKC